MMEYIKNISLFLIIGLIVTWLANWLQSDFLTDFLSENLITLLIALVAINTTTMSVVLTKIREITDKLGGNFTRTAKEMKVSIIEQVVLVIIAVIIQVIGASELIKTNFPPITFFANVVLVAIFSYALNVLYDTAKSVFVILQFENETSKPKNKVEDKKQ
ncbi:MAG: hypothetical protein AB1442_11605 [Nitrospirota bacterium]